MLARSEYVRFGSRYSYVVIRIVTIDVKSSYSFQGVIQPIQSCLWDCCHLAKKSTKMNYHKAEIYEREPSLGMGTRFLIPRLRGLRSGTQIETEGTRDYGQNISRSVL